MNQVPQKLRGALWVGTACRCLPFHSSNALPARRASFWKLIGLGIFRTGKHCHHLRNDLTRFAQHNTAADSDILFRNKILIVKRCAAYRRTG